MKKILIIICLGSFVFSCKTRKGVAKPVNTKTEQVVVKPKVEKVYASDTERYIDTYKAIAQNEMKLYNIPASITLAQGILESGSGKGRLSVEGNNHFGIKCHEWTGRRIFHDDDKKGECFRKYKEAKTSFRDHSLFLSQRDRYSKLFNIKPGNYKAWAKGLKAAGYATDPKYPQKLISLIERYELYKYDDEILQEKRLVNVKVLPKKKIHLVVKGDTLYYISKMHDISVEDLKRLNNLKDNTIHIGQKLQVNLD
ncbi:glucosaminidase domain-containing protein [Seonamhaeicola marinus]|uniref:Peptidoglycan hydrolase n=1 Tax=Seonamhaeicola marinus TaxID=1912246 RepID=A0A5D0HUK8_9FLAO|nr:glucosaminidase domain-containing protein [Seonamhaeicola marinus]TYA74996.1 LysM peptidoglycan-binding domain-containing protein [Seonamhaeicola marinus]